MALWSPPTSIEFAWSRYRGMGEIYWTDGTSIQVADENGGGMKVLLGGLTDPCGISVDVAGGKMYWARRQGDYDLPAVQRANLDGSEVEKLVVGYAGPTTGLALDVARGKMYWGYVDPHIDSLYAGFIMRSNLDGTEVEAVQSGLMLPMGLGLDPVGGMLYWSDTDALYRGRVDGTEREVIVRGLRFPGGVAVEGTVPEPGVLTVLGVGLLMLRRGH